MPPSLHVRGERSNSFLALKVPLVCYYFARSIQSTLDSERFEDLKMWRYTPIATRHCLSRKTKRRPSRNCQNGTSCRIPGGVCVRIASCSTKMFHVPSSSCDPPQSPPPSRSTHRYCATETALLLNSRLRSALRSFPPELAQVSQHHSICCRD